MSFLDDLESVECDVIKISSSPSLSQNTKQLLKQSTMTKDIIKITHLYHILLGLLDGVLNVEIRLCVSDRVTDTNRVTYKSVETNKKPCLHGAQGEESVYVNILLQTDTRGTHYNSKA